MVRNDLATIRSDQLAATRRNPWTPQEQETVRPCLHMILEEEWEHHRYAVRDWLHSRRRPSRHRRTVSDTVDGS